MQKTLLTFVDDLYEDLELWYPKLRLEEAGFGMRVAGPELKTYAGKHGYPAQADALISEMHSRDFCGLLVPGGFMPDKLRRDAKVLSLTREFFEQGQLVAFICHGGWIPISAKILKGKRVTGSRGIKDDLENAGGIWVDEPVVTDGNLISSRTPRDLAPFGKAMVDFLNDATRNTQHVKMSHANTGAHADPTFRSRPRATGEVIRRVGVYLRPYKLMVFGTIACAVLSLVSGFMFPALTRIIIDDVINQHRYQWLTPAALGLVGAFLFRELFNSLRIRINNSLEQNVIYDIRRHVYARLQRLPVPWFDQRASGDLMTRIIEDVNSVERLLIDGVEQGTVALLSIAAALFLMFHANRTLALISLIPVPFLIGGALWYTLTAHKRYRVQREASSAMNALLMDNLQGIRQIKAFGRQAHEDERFAQRADDLREGTLVVMRAWANYGPTMQFFGAFGTALVLWVGGSQVIHGRMEVGQLIEFMFYAGMFFYEPIGRLHGLNQILQAARAAAARVFDILDMAEERSDRRGVLQKPIRGEVLYENVSFSYAQEERRAPARQDREHLPNESRLPDRNVTNNPISPPSPPRNGSEDQGENSPKPTAPIDPPKRAVGVSPAVPPSPPRSGGEGRGEVALRVHGDNHPPPRQVLQNISLRAAPGEMIALVGPTGAGKSTLVNLLPAFYEATAGKILIDGQDISGISLESLRENISVVSQEAFLFNGTVRENILYGRLNATEQELIAASRAANCHDFISKLPNGYDSRVGERGVKLSVGEKQRVSIARALLKDTPILVLDEATASVDTATEKLIQEALEHLMANRTSFVIAHRLSTIRNADQILVLRHGQIIERGTHDELLALNGLYAKLARIQGTTFIEEGFEKLEVG